MKKSIYISLLLLLLMLPSAFAQSSTEAAANAYRDGDFVNSIKLYEQIVAQGIHENKESAEIYYNLGNAYFRNGETAKAILNYERALLLNPGDSDTRHNLRFARTRLEDKIDVSDSFFLSNWIRSIRNIFNSNQWANIGIAFFILTLISLGSYFFVRKIWIRKVGFYFALFFLVIMLISNSFAFKQKRNRLDRNSGIVMAASASVMTSPDANSKELFRLHEGTKVKVKKSDGIWVEIEIANGGVGWTSKENIETI